jgi:hypothetical protein
MEDMDGDLLDLLKRGLDSFIKWDVIKYLHHHPDTAHLASELARHMNRNQADLEVELNDLVAAGIVDRCRMDQQPAFALPADPSARQVIERFLLACEDRYFRMKVVYHILREMR